MSLWSRGSRMTRFLVMLIACACLVFIGAYYSPLQGIGPARGEGQDSEGSFQRYQMMDTGANKESSSAVESQPQSRVICNRAGKDEKNVTALRKGMLVSRLYDNYTYCRNIVPFHGPFDFTPKSKNPCWWEGDVLRCLPYFLLAGFSKSGTTDLFFRIDQHPQLVNDVKEKHWFDYIRYFEKFRHINNYTAMYPRATKAIKKDLGRFNSSKLVTGDGTPCVAWFSLYWHCYQGNDGMEEPRYTNADVVYRMNPKMKIILLMREPVARLYSRFLTFINHVPYEAYQNPSPESFHQIVTHAVEEYKKCFKRWSPRHCAYNGTLYTEVKLRLQEGMYSVFIKDWLRVFPREQILFLRFEDYVHNQRETLLKVFSFLNLDPVKDETLDRIFKAKAKNTGTHYKIGQMLNETRKIAEEFYKPFVIELSELLKDKEYMWHYNDL